MDNQELVRNWQAKIIDIAERRLGRVLGDAERVFIMSRGGFRALEMMEESVSGYGVKELERYLNSEAGRGCP